MYEYRKSIKSSFSDELINTYVIRPIAGLLVWGLYRTRITPNEVTIASTIAGLAAALVYTSGKPSSWILAGLLVSLKDVLDSADGQLARAKQLYSRMGRFLDSIGDFVVNVAVFGAIGLVLWQRHGDPFFALLAFLGLAGITFRVSYHVFYQTSFLHLQREYQTNRTTEDLVEEDKQAGKATLLLQRVFLWIYGWQDRFIVKIDIWCQGARGPEVDGQWWYSDALGVRMASFMGMGTELFLLTVFSILNRLEAYLYFNLIVMNSLLAMNISYRRVVLRKELQRP